MSPDELNPPPWRDVLASLRAYRPEAVGETVRAWLEEFAPRNIRRVRGRYELPDAALWQRRIDLVLARAVTPWYGRRGWRVAGDSFGSCVCHSLAAELAVTPRATAIRHGTEWVLRELAPLVRCLRAFESVYALSRWPEDADERAVGVALSIGHVLDAVLEHSSAAGPWQTYATDGVLWLLDHHRLPRPPVLVDLVAQTVEGLGAVALAPGDAERHRACDDLAATVTFAAM